MYDFELNLLELTNKHPKYSEIGHNFGLILQLDFKSILDNATDEKKSIILRIDKQFRGDENVTEIPLGKCVVLYHKGSILERPLFDEKVADYLKALNLKAKGPVYTFPIINRFYSRQC